MSSRLVLRCLSFLSLSFAVLFPAGAQDKTPPPVESKSWLDDWTQQTYMLGDWGGYRTKLSDSGVNFEFLYFSALPTNLAGGIKTGTVYEGLLWMSMDIDTEKLFNLQGGRFYVSSIWIQGNKFSLNYVGDVNLTSLLDLPHAFRLLELYYEQKFWDDRISIKVGQLSIDRDFLLPELYNGLGGINFLNQTFFYPTVAFGVFDRSFFPVENHSLASTPFATPGARFRIDFTPKAYLQAGIYGGKADSSYHGVAFPLSRDEGVLCYFETGYKFNRAAEDTGLPGSYKLGGYFHSDSFADNDALLNVFGLPSSGEMHDSNWGIYFLAEQMLFFEGGVKDPAEQGLLGFARFAYSPPDRNFFQWGADGGLVYKGAIPTRDYDTLGLAFSYISVSDDIVDVQNQVNAAIPNTFPNADFEAVLELNYKAQITPWMTAQTSLQRVFHPGARLATELPDAWVFIMQTSLRF